MMAGKAQASQQPTAMGSMLQAATYGNVIPVNMGLTLCPLNVIWANNIRQGGSTKKFKQLKKGITSYVENINFLACKNPAIYPFQMWANGGLYPLEFTSFSFSYQSSGQIWIPNSTSPDPYFYAIIAVTVVSTYSETFNDYGNPNGPQTVTGTQETPLWNQLIAGPDPTNASFNLNYPYTYRWQPSFGPTFWIDAMADNVFGVGQTFKVYYARVTAATSYQAPMSRLRLSWESILGSGNEYDGFSSEQIEYPMYAGMGSPDIDLGSTGAIPQLNVEILGKYSVYSTGDCDFVDMIEDTAKSGITQSALGGAQSFNATQHGVGCFDYPGPIQQKCANHVENHNNAISFDMPNTAGNILLAWCLTDESTPPTVSDSQGNTWYLVTSGTYVGRPDSYALYYAPNCKAGPNTVSWSGYGFYDGALWVMELQGVDTFDTMSTIETGANPSVSITTTNSPGLPELLIAVSLGGTPQNTALWPVTFTPQGPGPNEYVQTRIVTNPGTYTVTNGGGGSLVNLTLLGFKATQPPTYPNPLPNFLDKTTKELTRAQCRANGIWGSLSMNTQKSARDWLTDFYQAAVSAPVMSGFKLKSIPYSEVSAAGNGAVYIAPTAAGPVAELDVDNGDFICSKNESPIVIERAARTDLNTVLQMQHIDRNANYQQVVTAVSDAASVLQWGVRKADPIVNNAIQDPSIARQILQIMVRRQNYIGPVTYKFKLPARWQLLEAMDLITITDTQQGINGVPVRLTSVSEDDQYGRTCEAKPFMYGINAPGNNTVTSPTPYSPVTGTSAGNVNTPVIFEPVPRLYGSQNQAQLWVVVSSPSAIYGGCQVMISTDGGLSYNLAGDPLAGSAITGVSTADWPAATSPDTTNNLALNLTESNGELASYQTSDEDNFLYPCYMAGGGTYPITYELMTYATATLTGTNLYTLAATGGAHLNRGVFGAPSPGVGVDHPSGSRFAFLPPDGQGILKLNMDPTWIGKLLYFKILSFNTFGSAIQSLSSVTAYTYTPTGAAGAVNSGGIPVQGFQVNGA
jgi:hypothetical protein